LEEAIAKEEEEIKRLEHLLNVAQDWFKHHVVSIISISIQYYPCGIPLDSVRLDLHC
jgi:hypothetical protein